MAEEKPNFGNAPIAQEIWDRYYKRFYGQPLHGLVEEKVISSPQGYFSLEKLGSFIDTNAKNLAWSKHVPNLPEGERIKALQAFVEPVSGLPMSPRDDIIGYHRWAEGIGAENDFLLTSLGRQRFEQLAKAIARQEAIDIARGEYPFIHRLLGNFESDVFKTTRKQVEHLASLETDFNDRLSPRQRVDFSHKRDLILTQHINELDEATKGKSALLQDFLARIMPDYRPRQIPAHLGETPDVVFQNIPEETKNLNISGYTRKLQRIAKSQGPFLLEGAGTIPMLADVHRYLKGGFDINTGQTYYPSELTEIDGVHIPNERIDELMKYHPKNAAKYPEITDNQRYKVHPAWFDEDPAITKKKADEKFKKETGAKGPVPMTTPTPSVSINIDTNSDIGAFLFS